MPSVASATFDSPYFQSLADTAVDCCMTISILIRVSPYLLGPKGSGAGWHLVTLMWGWRCLRLGCPVLLLHLLIVQKRGSGLKLLSSDGARNVVQVTFSDPSPDMIDSTRSVPDDELACESGSLGLHGKWPALGKTCIENGLHWEVAPETYTRQSEPRPPSA